MKPFGVTAPLWRSKRGSKNAPGHAWKPPRVRKAFRAPWWKIRTALTLTMQNRINLGKSSPELYQAVFALEKLAVAAAAAAGIPKAFTHLLKLRASQINQCAFCVRMHTRDALASGESSDRVAVLPAWRETDYFDEKERAALEVTEAITLISTGQFPDAVYEEAAAKLSKEEMAAIEWISIVINTWNRIAIASRYPVGPKG